MPPVRRGPGEKPKDLTGTLRRLLGTMGKFRAAFIAVLVFAMLSTIFNIAGPKILAEATTALATGWYAMITGTGSIDFGYIGQILLILLGMYLLSACFSFVQGWLMSGVSQRLCYDLRRQISEKINRLPLAYFEKRTVGEVLSRITNDVDTLGQSLNQSVTTLITSITTMIGVLIMMLSISPAMTLIAILILPVSICLVLLVVRFSQKYFRAQQKYLGDVNGQVEEVYSGHNVVKAFNREAAVLDEFGTANDKLYESAWKSQFLSGLMMPVMNFVGNLGYVAVAVVGSIFAAQGIITIGEIQAFIQYVKTSPSPSSSWRRCPTCCRAWRPPPSACLSFWPSRRRTRRPTPPAAPTPPASTAMWTLTMCALATTRTRSSSTTSAAMWSRARRWPSSAPPAPARPPWSSC